MNPLQNALVFLVHTIFNIFISLILIKFLLQVVKADPYNYFSQLIIKLTNPIIKPIKKIIPNFWGLDFATLLLLILLQASELITISLIKGYSLSNLNVLTLFGILIWGFGELLSLTVNVFFINILVMIIISWFPVNRYHPLISLISQLTSPLFNLARRIVPPIHGLDLSAIFILLAMQFINILITVPMMQIGARLMSA